MTSNGSSELIINVHGLKKSFDNKVAVNGVDLKVYKGEVFGFLGPNGSGKTTTIRMLCGLLKADAGQGCCLGFDIRTQAEQIKERVGYMIQKFSLYFDLTIEENLSFIARVYRIKNGKEKIANTLERMGLKDSRKQLTGKLSGGWKQRVALACCLLHEPELLLLDEPTAGVDPIARREFWDQIHYLSEEGITTLVSTHYMDEAERCTRIAYLDNGQVVVRGSVAEVISHTHLETWQITSNVTTALLKTVKKLDGVVLAALFGNAIHVCGYDGEKIEKELGDLCLKTPFEWGYIKTTLEDTFITLVSQSKEP